MKENLLYTVRIALAFCLFLVLTADLASAGTLTSSVSVTATILSKDKCSFNTTSATLNFGTLNPANPVTVTATAPISFSCQGSANPATYYMDQDGGLYNSVAPTGNKMEDPAGPYYIPYTLNLPATGTVPHNTNETFTLTGTVLGTDYVNAYAGSYSDTVTITITP